MPVEFVSAIRAPAAYGTGVYSFEEFIFIDLDVTTSEQYTHSSTLSKSPIPGSNVSDHITDTGVTINITGFVVDTPNSYLEWRSGRGMDIIDQLNDMRREAIPVTVFTGLGSWSNMLITQLSYERSGDPSTRIRVSLTFEQYRTYIPTLTEIDAGLLESPRRASADAGVDPSALDAAAQAEEAAKGAQEQSSFARISDALSAQGIDFEGLLFGAITDLIL